jgi:hypothetical protein
MYFINFMELKVPYTDFVSSVADYLGEANTIKLKQQNVVDDTSLEAVKKEMSLFTERCATFIENSFQPLNTTLANEFRFAMEQRFSISGAKKTLEQTKKEVFEDFQCKIEHLQYNSRLIRVGDIFIDPDKVKQGNRDKWATEEIMDLVLEKLYDLYDDFFHPVQEILEWNGIPIRRHGEEREYMRLLEDLGYISLAPGREPAAQLTLTGKIYIEEKRKAVRENYETITASVDEMSKRIDEVAEELRKQGYGQEILFEELQEIKEAYSSMNKKNWGQLVKGKLVDIALGKLVENDTLKYIYHHVTDHILRLP